VSRGCDDQDAGPARRADLRCPRGPGPRGTARRVVPGLRGARDVVTSSSSRNKLVWRGLDELRAELRKLPEDLAGEASAIIATHATGAQQEIIAGYPDVSGRLRGGVRLGLNSYGRYGANYILKSTAKIAWIFEHGSKPREYKGTDKIG